MTVTSGAVIDVGDITVTFGAVIDVGQITVTCGAVINVGDISDFWSCYVSSIPQVPGSVEFIG